MWCQQSSTRVQDIREYELDYEAAKKAAAAAAFEAEKEEERRIKLLEKNPLGELIVEEEEDLNFGERLPVQMLKLTSYWCYDLPAFSPLLPGKISLWHWLAPTGTLAQVTLAYLDYRIPSAWHLNNAHPTPLSLYYNTQGVLSAHVQHYGCMVHLCALMRISQGNPHFKFSPLLRYTDLT